MKKIKYLNLYCGIGGNRELLKDNVEVTAVEIDKNIAKEYKSKFPNDNLIIGDAHEYLLKHFKEFDFIWSSPPCPTHSRTNYFLKGKGVIRYIDMNLYQEIILLQTHFKGLWVVENVIPYYEPLISAKRIGRHLFWSNFNITSIETKKDDIGKMCGQNQKAHKKRLEDRNAVDSRLGLHIFNCAFGIENKPLLKYMT